MVDSARIKFSVFEGKSLTDPEINLISAIRVARENILREKQFQENERKELQRISQTIDISNSTRFNSKIQDVDDNQSTLQANIKVPKNNSRPDSINSKRSFEALEGRKNLSQDDDEDNMNFNKFREESLVESEQDYKFTRKEGVNIDLEDEIEWSIPRDHGVLYEEQWSSLSPLAENKSFQLSDFDEDGNNTIGLLVTVPKSSSGWAFNITPSNDIYSTDIRMHFNPRYMKEELVLNDRRGTWGDPMRKKLREKLIEGIRAEQIILKIRIRPEGYIVYANEVFTAFFPHRSKYPLPKDLKIDFPVRDANGKIYGIFLSQVWWGHCDLANDQLSSDQLRQITELSSPARQPESVRIPLLSRTLFVKGIPVTNDLEELQGIEYALQDPLEQVFGSKVVFISLIVGTDFGYVRFSEPGQLDTAISIINEIQFEDEQGNHIPLRAIRANESILGMESALVNISIST